MTTPVIPEPRKRAHVSLETKLASALLALGHVPYEHAKLMTARQMLSLYQFDHGILHAFDGPDEFWNLTPRLITPHRLKSAKDTGIVAKVQTLSEAQESFRRLVLSKPCGAKRQTSGRWPSRKLTSRGFGK